jgi:subtilisin family serine protease
VNLRWILPFIGAVILPFAFNACQGGLLSGKGFSSSSSSLSCKVYNGKTEKMVFNPSAKPSAFVSKKVRLRDDSAPNAANVHAKASGELAIDAGSHLGVIMDNACLQARRDLSNTVISKAIADSGQVSATLDHQAYEWVLPQAYSDLQIEQMADSEECVLGISWNRAYKVQAAFSDSNMFNQDYLNYTRAFDSYDYFYNAGGGMDPQNGNPVIVAVADTGVDLTHPDLIGNLWTHSKGVGIDITTLGSANVNYQPTDISSIGHGTHVAGMIGAVSNNGVGIIGAMPYRVKIMPIRLFVSDAAGNLSTTSQYFYNAMRFAYMNGASVINLSLGSITAGPASDSLALSGVQEAVNAGSTVVVVIGNADSGQNGQEVNGTTLSSIPGQFATIPGVIGVGSIDTLSGGKSFFSHYSTTYAEIAAPGAQQNTIGVYSTLPTTLSSYGRLAGTSQAAPQVSAAAALTIGIIRDAMGIAPSPAEVERLILASAVKDPNLVTYFKDGNRLDYVNLVQTINSNYPQTSSGAYGAGLGISSLGCQ